MRTSLASPKRPSGGARADEPVSRGLDGRTRLTYGFLMRHQEKQDVRSLTRDELAEELVTLGDIAAWLGRPYDTISKWRDRHSDFPAPVAETIRARIYLRSEIAAWLKATDRLPADEGGSELPINEREPGP